MSFHDMHKLLSAAKLSFVGPSTFSEHFDDLLLTLSQQELLAGLADPVLRVSAQDMLLSTSFRKDYWAKGARAQGPEELVRRLRAQRVVLMRDRERVALSVPPSAATKAEEPHY